MPRKTVCAPPDRPCPGALAASEPFGPFMIYPSISSRDNPVFKRLKLLAGSARERRACGQVLLDGAHLVEAYLQTGGVPELLVLSADARTPDVEALLLRLSGLRTVVMPAALFAALSPVATPTGMLALVDTPQPAIAAQPDCVLMLENVQDPGNVGSILRSAAAARVDAVYLSGGCAEAWSPKALRGGQGAQFALPVVEGADLLQEVARFDGTVYATVMRGEPLYAQDFSGRTAFLVGNEGSGLSPALIEAAGRRITIPCSEKVESLNVAAAVAVCLFERMRQTGKY